MNEIIFWLNDTVSASGLIALGASFLWGIASVLLSPCHLGTIPLVVAYVGTTEAGRSPSRSRASALSFSFAGGMFVAVAVLGILVTTAGWAVAGYTRYTNYVIAIIFMIAGLNLVGLLTIPGTGMNIASPKRKGHISAVMLGFIFGVGLSPCTFAFLAPVLAASFGSATANPAFGGALLITFGVGHCGVIGIAGTSTGLVQRYLNWNAQSRGLAVMKGVCGALLLVSASYLVYTA